MGLPEDAKGHDLFLTIEGCDLTAHLKQATSLFSETFIIFESLLFRGQNSERIQRRLGSTSWYFTQGRGPLCSLLLLLSPNQMPVQAYMCMCVLPQSSLQPWLMIQWVLIAPLSWFPKLEHHQAVPPGIPCTAAPGTPAAATQTSLGTVSVHQWDSCDIPQELQRTN